jgi:hypothetical protein
MDYINDICIVVPFMIDMNKLLNLTFSVAIISPWSVN